MKWAEVILVQSTQGNREKMMSNLQELVDEVRLKNQQARIRIYNRERIDTHICIVLLHDRKKEKSGGSRLGLRLTDALKELGQVHRTVWIEIEQKGQSC